MGIDNTGRSYTLPAHSLPGARGQGEPLTGRLTLPDQSSVEYMLSADVKHPWLLSTDAGFGFICHIDDMGSKNKAGKSLITTPAGARILPPQPLSETSNATWLAVVTNEGRLLTFPIQELPTLARGKGNKLININAARAASREELMTQILPFAEHQILRIHSGKRHLKLKFSDLEHYIGERGRRGNKLPRGFQRVDRIEIAE